jgi:hypothetical protein
LKRPIPSFSIEIRRRPGRANGPGIDARLLETKAPLSEFDRDSHRAAAAIFAPRSAVVAPIMAPTSAPTGRVLPVLVFDQPLNAASRDELSTVAESERELQATDRPAPRSRDHFASPPKSRNRSVPSPEKPPSIASNRPGAAVDDSPKPRTDDGARNSKRKRAAQESGNARRASVQTSHVSAAPRNNKQVALMDHRPSQLSEDRNPTSVVGDLQVPSSNASVATPRIRKRTILGRYVTGDELMPGQRWKLRLRKWR